MPEDPLHQIKPMPASSMTDLLLAKAKPISDSSSASIITYLRRGKKQKTSGGERSENM